MQQPSRYEDAFGYDLYEVLGPRSVAFLLERSVPQNHLVHGIFEISSQSSRVGREPPKI